LYLAFVKKAGSLFLLLLFFIFQYGKMLDYMECRIRAAIETKSDCGCDLKLTAATDNNPVSAPFHQHHLKNYTEEFFDYHFLLLPTMPFCNTKEYNTAFNQPIPEGRYNVVFQPPRS
jgi:hypothetical protein